MGSRKSNFSDGASPGKIFIRGLARETTLEQFVKYFEKYGEIIDSVIMKYRHTGRPRGFRFITYADPTVVDTVIAENHTINDKKVETKKAESKKPSNPASAPAYGSNTRGRGYGDSYGGFADSYIDFDSGGFGPSSYRSFGSRYGDYGYGGREFDGRYGDFGSSVFGGYHGDLSLGYSSRFGLYAGDYGGGYGSSGLEAYGRGGGYGRYGGAGPGAGYESGPGAGYGGPGGLDGSRGGYSGSGRYHPYAR